MFRHSPSVSIQVVLKLIFNPVQIVLYKNLAYFSTYCLSTHSFKVWPRMCIREVQNVSYFFENLQINFYFFWKFWKFIWRFSKKKLEKKRFWKSSNKFSKTSFFQFFFWKSSNKFSKFSKTLKIYLKIFKKKNHNLNLPNAHMSTSLVKL